MIDPFARQASVGSRRCRFRPDSSTSSPPRSAPPYVLTEPEQLATYDCDGLTGWRAQPACVVLPGSTEDVQAVVRLCAREGIPFVARGAGTGLSGGALPVADGIVISLARMKPDPRDRPRERARRRRAGRDEPRRDARRCRRRATSTPPTRRASRSARSAATSRRTRAARTASRTASRSTTSPARRSCCPTASCSSSAARRSTRRRARPARRRSSARRARSGSPSR